MGVLNSRAHRRVNQRAVIAAGEPLPWRWASRLIGSSGPIGSSGLMGFFGALGLSAILGPGAAAQTPGAPAEDSPAAESPLPPGTGEDVDPIDAAVEAALLDAPRSTKIGRIRAVRLRSTVTFDGAPDRPHELEVSFAFPAKARMSLSHGGSVTERFLLGAATFGREQSRGAPESPSYALRGDSGLETRIDFALRRAVMMWPNAPVKTDVISPGDEPSDELGDELKGVGVFEGAGRSFTARIDGIGVLLADVDETTGRPSRMRAFDTKGRASAELRITRWSEQDGRWWPRDLSFHAGGGRIWTETVDAIETTWRFTDTWFLPPDRVRVVLGKAIEERVRLRPEPGAWTRRGEFDPSKPPANLAAAVEQALDAYARQSAAESTETTPVPRGSILLDGALRPLAYELESTRRGDAKAAAAENFRDRPARQAWVLLLDRASLPGSDLIDALVAAATGDGAEPADDGPTARSGAVPGNPQLRVRFEIEEVPGKPRRAVSLRVVHPASPTPSGTSGGGAGADAPIPPNGNGRPGR